MNNRVARVICSQYPHVEVWNIRRADCSRLCPSVPDPRRNEASAIFVFSYRDTRHCSREHPVVLHIHITIRRRSDRRHPPACTRYPAPVLIRRYTRYKLQICASRRIKIPNTIGSDTSPPGPGTGARGRGSDTRDYLKWLDVILRGRRRRSRRVNGSAEPADEWRRAAMYTYVGKITENIQVHWYKVHSAALKIIMQ